MRSTSNQVSYYRIISLGSEGFLDPLHQWLPASTAIVYVFLTAQILHLFCRCSLAGFPLTLGFTFPCYRFPRVSSLQCQQGSINLPPSPSFHHSNCRLQNSPTAAENFDSSGVPKVSSPSDVGSRYLCMRETICTGLGSDHMDAQLCRQRKSPVLAQLLPGFPLLFPVANKRGVNAPAEHCRRG